MRRFLLTGAALLTALAVSPAAAEDAPTDAQKALADATQAYREGDCAKAASLVAPIVSAPKSATAKEIALAYDIAMDCASQSKDMAKAEAYAKRAITLDGSSDFAWRVAVISDFNAKRYAAAFGTINQMLAAGRQDTLNSFPVGVLLQLHVLFERGGDAANDTRLLAILASPSYDPSDLSTKIDGLGDYLRALYARKLLAAGKREEARALISGLHGYEAVMEIAFDPGLLALQGHPVDFRAVAEADLARHRAMVVRYPQSLAAINAVALDLTRLGRSDEAITLLKATMPRVGAADAFEDAAEKAPWFWNALGQAYFATGRYDEMIAAYTKGGQSPDGGSPNVNQVINLAGKQLDFGRAKEALATLDRLGDSPDVNPYGAMQIRGVRGCAHAVLGDLEKARAELAYAAAHENDDPVTVSVLYLCLGDENAAAASYVRRLAAPESRRIAMLALADYDAPDGRTPKSAFADRFDRVRKRPEVVAAIRAAGGPVRIHLPDAP